MNWFASIAVLFALNFDVPRDLKVVTAPYTGKTLKVANWNIDHGTNLDIIAKQLHDQSFDLILCQEVDFDAARSGRIDVAAELARKLTLNMSYGIEFEELSQEKETPAYIGQATLSRLPIKRSRILRFARQSTFWQPHAWLPSKLPMMQRRLGSRIALVTDVEFGGKPLVIYNAHLESRSMGSIQAKQLDEMLADLDTYPKGTPVILGGDLNSKYFPSLVLHKLQKLGFRSALGDKIERTHKIAMALDWIFIRGPIEWEAGSLHRDAKGSDHYPIYATLKSQ